MTIFLPDTNYACFVINDANTIRAYENVPARNSTSSYTDFYINSHYISKNGSQTWGNTSTLPICSGEDFTTNVFYRNDFADIMIIFFLILIICFYFPYRIISRAFGRWLKW